LSLKILSGLAENLAFVGIISYYFAERDQSGWNMLLTQSVRERVSFTARALAEDLRAIGNPSDAGTLARYGAEYGVHFSVLPPPDLDGEAQHDLVPGPFFHHGGHFHGGHGPLDAGQNGGGSVIGIMHSVGAPGYEVMTQVILGGNDKPPLRYFVVAHAADFSALLRFLGIQRVLLFAFLIFAGSALVWWPFVWNMQRTVGRLSDATRQITAGNLAVQLSETRRDELGALAEDINLMAARLAAHLQSQQQFVADVAHEVISPVARMQIGLGILKAQVSAENQRELADVQEDLQSMASMLEELLLFSRTGISAHVNPPRTILLLPLIEQVISREASLEVIPANVPDGLEVRVQPAMLERALANLLRNAVRYAGDAPPDVKVTAEVSGPRVIVRISDRGPGVPASALGRLGEPFFRPDLARSPNLGGVGLGLAIVRRCVAACAGTVVFRNRPDGGFEAEVELPGV
jgi:signal transduction histidine kinase